MNILVVGGTRFFGVHLVHTLLKQGHEVTILTRGNVKDGFGDSIHRIRVDRSNEDAMKSALQGKFYDVICDNIAFCSNDVKYLLESVGCNRYIQTSSVSVYPQLGLRTKEEDFDAGSHPLIWCNREDYPYDEIKRQAECALVQNYPTLSSAAVRLPYVIGEDDYTKRLYFYVENIVKGIPMYVDNPQAAISYIRSKDAGDFIAWLVGSTLTGPVNAASMGTITLEEVFDYIGKQTGRKPILTPEAKSAPYNGGEDFSLNTEKADAAGYHFSELKSWIYDLLDYYIADVMN